MGLNTLPNQPYYACIVDYELLEAFGGPDSMPLAKVYFVDILGRDKPEDYEWAHSNLDKGKILQSIASSLLGLRNFGVPHIIVVFPHVTSDYRFGDPRDGGERETNLYKAGTFRTKDLEEGILDLEGPAVSRSPFEVACPAEAHIIGEEFDFFNEAQNVRAYMKTHVPLGLVAEVRNPNKIRQFLEERIQ